MSAAERLAGWFVAPAAADRTSEREAAGEGVGVAPVTRLPAIRAPTAPAVHAEGVRVCVLGTERAGARFAAALAARLARRPGARFAVLCSAERPSSGAPVGPPAPAARRVARALVLEGRQAEVVGRVVRVALDDAPTAATLALAAVAGCAAGAPVVTLLRGVRSAALDDMVSGQDVVLAVMSEDTDDTLCELALAELEALAPQAVVCRVALPRRPSATARRRALTVALEAVG